MVGKDLFGMESTTVPRYPNKYLEVYDSYEVVSALVKEIRLGNVEDALYWLEVMLKGKAGLSYIARRLMIESQESGFGAEPAIYAKSVFDIISIGKEHAQDSLFQLVVYLCKAKKWWEDEYTRNSLKKWYQAEKLVIKVRDGEKAPKSIPKYALDRHTKRGNQMRKDGQKIDERFSGTEKGIFSMIALFEKNGRLHKDDYLTSEEERKSRRFLYEG